MNSPWVTPLVWEHQVLTRRFEVITAQTYELVNALKEHIPLQHLAVHFHDTYGQALANILVALQVEI